MVGLFFIAFGLLSVIFSRVFTRWAIVGNYKILGIRFSEKGYRPIFIIVGIIFTVIGILELLEIVKFK